MEQELSCSICRELFTDPVLLGCCHSFCRDCLETWTRDKHSCPECREPIRPTSHLLLNLSLKNATEAYKQQKASEPPECSCHSEKMKLYCLDCDEMVCLICRDSRSHSGHRFKPISEVAQERRAYLTHWLNVLLGLLKDMKERKAWFDDAADHLKSQAGVTKAEIKAYFEGLTMSLWHERRYREKALEREEQQKTRIMVEVVTSVNRDIEMVSQTISELEELLKAPDASLLLHYKATMEKVQRCFTIQEKRMEPGALIDQGQYVGNIRIYGTR